MKTYTKTSITEEPRLVISYDPDPESPREWSNLGYFITIDSNYHSPDGEKRIGNDDYQPSWFLKEIIKETGDMADNQKDHMKMIKEKFEGEEGDGDKIIAIYPIVKHEHGNVYYHLGTSYGFDDSNNGFYIITSKTQKETGIKTKDYEKVIEQELECYNKYMNGEIYNFILHNKKGELEESCSGFYDIEDIREHLPKEYKKEDLQEYFNHG